MLEIFKINVHSIASSEFDIVHKVEFK